MRDVEGRIERNLNPADTEAEWQPLIEPELFRPEAGIPQTRDEHLRQMLDLVVLAFQTDTTRVATFMMAHGFSRQNFTFLDGVSGDHHSISHHKENPELTEPYTIVSRWYVSQLAYLVEKMGAIDEGEGRTLLDNTMILYGSALKNGNGHTTQNLPILLAGRGGGRLNPGRRIVLPEETPITKSPLDAGAAHGGRGRQLQYEHRHDCRPLAPGSRGRTRLRQTRRNGCSRMGGRNLLAAAARLLFTRREMLPAWPLRR